MKAKFTVTLFILLITGLLFAQPEDISQINSSASIRQCEISITGLELIQIIGIGIKIPEPLHIISSIVFKNNSGSDIQIDYSAYLYDKSGNKYPVILGLYRQDMEPLDNWSKNIKAGELKSVKLSSMHGPELGIGSSAVLVINFKDKSGNDIWIKSPESTVKASPLHRSDRMPVNDIFKD